MVMFWYPEKERYLYGKLVNAPTLISFRRARANAQQNVVLDGVLARKKIFLARLIVMVAARAKINMMMW